MNSKFLSILIFTVALHAGFNVKAQTCGNSVDTGTGLMSKCLPPNPNMPGNSASSPETAEPSSVSKFGDCHYFSMYPPRIALHDKLHVCVAVASCIIGAEPDDVLPTICKLKQGTCPDATTCVNDSKVHAHPNEVKQDLCLENDGTPTPGCTRAGIEAPGMNGRY